MRRMAAQLLAEEFAVPVKPGLQPTVQTSLAA